MLILRAAFRNGYVGGLSSLTSIRMNNIDENLSVAVENTAVYFDIRHKYVINKKVAQTLEVQHGRSDEKRFNVCVAGAGDGTKPRLLIIFKGAINGPILNSFQEFMPPIMCGSRQAVG